MKTTLNAIRTRSPCPFGWSKLLKYLGKTRADDEPLSILTILESNGLDDALWALRAVKGHDREIRLLAVAYARQVQHLLTDKRSLDALDVAERFANGKASRKELAAAHISACCAAKTSPNYAAWAVVSATPNGDSWHAAWATKRDLARAIVQTITQDASGHARITAWATQKLIEICEDCQ